LFLILLQLQDWIQYLGKLKDQAEEGPHTDALKSALEEQNLDFILQESIASTSLLLTVESNDIESAFQFLMTILQSQFGDQLNPSLVAVAEQVSQSQVDVSLKLKVLKNVSRWMDLSTEKLAILKLIIGLAAEKPEDIQSLLKGSSKLLSQINAEERQEFYVYLSDTVDSAWIFSILVDYLKEEQTPNDAVRKVLLKALTLLLTEPNLFHFEQVLKLKVVQAFTKEPLVQFATLFLEKGLSDYQTFVAKQGNEFFKTHHLSEPQCLRKFRLISLAAFAETKVGQTVSYADVAKAIDVKEEEVELWVMDAVSMSLLSAQMNQLTSKVTLQ
jgi:translation initiation factor 3 subunit M